MVWLNDDLFYAMRAMKEEEIRRLLEARRVGRRQPAGGVPSPRRDPGAPEAAPAAGLCQPGCCAGGAA